MSGFAGILNLDGAPVDRRLLDQMTRALRFRGPDAEEIWNAGSVGLGHTMLRTATDSPAQRQPFVLEGRLWITADARLDARADLVEKLRAAQEAAGAVSLATPDAELILRAYAAWGEACVEHLQGDFSFAVWDSAKRRLFCARDHFGVKLLYYARAGNALLFSNTLDVLRLHPGISAKLRDAYIGDYLLIGCDMHPALTPFEQIEKLPPAHTLTASQENVRIARFWSFPIEEPLRARRSHDVVDEFRALLKKAVEDRLHTDRASISLSAGLDSTTVAAEAASQIGDPKKLLGATYGFNRAIRDPEPALARAVANHLGMKFHYLAADDYALFDRCASLASRYPWPTDLAQAASVSDLYEIVAAHGRVLLTGEGGDFGMAPSLSVYRGLRLFDLFWNVGKYVLSHAYIPRIGFRVTWQRWLGKTPEVVPAYPPWLQPEFEARTNLRDRFRELTQSPPRVHPFRPDSYASLVSPFVSTIFENYDATYTRLPLEVRHPLFDVRLQRFFLRLPTMPWCADKELLRVAMRSRLPEKVLRRPKAPVPGDPLPALLQAAGPDRLGNVSPAPGFERYLALEKFKMPVKEGDMMYLELYFRALSLNYWLQSTNLFR